MTTGPTILVELGLIEGAIDSVNSLAKMACCSKDQSVPPQASGQDGTAQPLWFKILCHSRAAGLSA